MINIYLHLQVCPEKDCKRCKGCSSTICMDSHVIVIDLCGMIQWQKRVCLRAWLLGWIRSGQWRTSSRPQLQPPQSTDGGDASAQQCWKHVHVHARMHAQTCTRGPPTLRSFNICSDFDGSMTVVKVSDHLSELHDKPHWSPWRATITGHGRARGMMAHTCRTATTSSYVS